MTSMAAGMHARGMESVKEWHGRVLVGCNGRGEREGLGPVRLEGLGRGWSSIEGGGDTEDGAEGGR